jgi:TetR/AcrR family transcriptional repressor of nem operon
VRKNVNQIGAADALEKSFDLEDVTALAIAVFWIKGYEAKSISNLTKIIGINKGSLYNTFGSKKICLSTH